VYTYHYVPNIASAALDAGLFAALVLPLMILTFVYGGRFMYIVAATSAIESLGYGLRILATQEQALGPFIGSTLLLLMAPIALALVNYIVVARLVKAMGKPVPVCGIALKPSQISKLFLTSDVVCFFVQAAGGGLLSIGTEDMNQVGTAVVLTGLAIQLSFFFAFCWIVYCLRTRDEFELKFIPSLRPVFTGLVITISLLLVRNVYRVVEFSSGISGYVAVNEWVFNIFETLPIFLAVVAYAMFHFGRLLECASKNPTWIAELEALRRESLNGDKRMASLGEENIDPNERLEAPFIHDDSNVSPNQAGSVEEV